MHDTDNWIAHFERNALNRPEPDWSSPVGMSGGVLEKLINSIQQFQLGDGGGPAYLVAWDRGCFLKDANTKRLVDLWFKEEREHSRLLGCALTRFGGEEIKNHWSFGLFCAIRKLFGVRFELHALLGTEIVSHVYYKMLQRHGKDTALHQMCALIIRDEAGHIAFHRARLYGEYGTTILSRAFFVMRGLVAGTVLWVNHRGALLAMGGTDAEFYRWIMRDLNAFVRALGAKE